MCMKKSRGGNADNRGSESLTRVIVVGKYFFDYSWFTFTSSAQKISGSVLLPSVDITKGRTRLLQRLDFSR